MRLTIILAAAAGLFAAPGLAQEGAPGSPQPDSREDAAPDKTSGESSGEISGEAEEELTELDRLSRGSADAFENAAAAHDRVPLSVTLRALDKITARYTDLEIEMHQIGRFGSLEIQPRYCDKRPPEEFPETTAFLEIFDMEGQNNRQSDFKDAALINAPSPARNIKDRDPNAPEALGPEALSPEALRVVPLSNTAAANERLGPGPDREGGQSLPDRDGGQPLPDQPLTRAPSRTEPAPEVLTGPQAQGENIFRGWMFASSPALNGLEHPVYDVWVIDCATQAADN